MAALQDAARAFMTYGSYYVFLFLFCALIYRYFLIRHRIINFFKTDPRGALICVALVTVVFVSVAPELRVTGDENDLLGVANGMSMTSAKRADRAMDLHGMAGDLYTGSWGMDFRALGFPFAEQVAYVFSGDLSEKKAFVLNAIFLFVFLWIIYRAFERRLGWAWAFSALLAVLAHPVLNLSAASAGYDLAALLFLTLSLVSLHEFLEAPDQARFGFLWVHLLVLANLRHEGILLFGLTVVWLLIWGRDTARYMRSEPLFWCTPFVLAPLICQRLFVPFWGQAPGKTVLDFFSISRVSGNAASFFIEASVSKFRLPFAGVWIALGAVAAAYFVWNFFRQLRVWSAPQRRFWLLAASWIITLFLLVSAYGPKTFRSPVTARYYLPIAVFLSIASAAFLSRFRFMNSRRFFAAALAVFLLYHPIAVSGAFSRTYMFNREFHFVDSFLMRQPDRVTCVLIVTMPQQYAADWSVATVSPWYVNENARDFINQIRSVYSRAFVVERVDRKTGKLERGVELDKAFRQETIDELVVNSDSSLRISQVFPGSQVSGRSDVKNP